ncbi:G2/mitotic-specific cyclin cdc13 [Ceratobasidium theobromae]|uniref:G2/mitotic-specific cyclin cdc13 n=1 Tax=Ceratobasidium theobromae TaxID=1582974 RepID=A0A5N5QWW9_9AGAM|nr:G2/mitotic-specific cyclin cdc13 [Ceratobasidium theobromae]
MAATTNPDTTMVDISQPENSLNDTILKKTASHPRLSSVTGYELESEDRDSLLDIVVDSMGKQLKDTTRECTRTDGGLAVGLMRAHGLRDFTHVLAYLNTKPEWFLPAGRSKIPGYDPFHNAFVSEYKGNCHEVFLNTLNGYLSLRSQGGRKVKPYARTISVVQSSGMGKSRMIQEASSLVFTIPINLREELLSREFAYPPPDVAVRDYFTTFKERSDEAIEIKYTVFLDELFKHTLELIRRLGYDKESDLNQKWSEFLMEGQRTTTVGENRKRFFDTVVQNAEHRPETTLNIVGLKVSLQRSCEELRKAVTSQAKENRRFYLVSFDEAHGLNKPPIGGKITRSLYQNLEKVLAGLQNHRAFFVFLSTNFSLRQSPPSIVGHPSARSYAPHGDYLYPPITELPFDVFAKDYLQNNKPYTLENLCTIEAMSQFGRGLWHTHHEEWSKQARLVEGCFPSIIKSSLETVVKLAQSKLDPPNPMDLYEYQEHFAFNAGPPPKPTEVYLAAIGVRVGLTFDQSTTYSNNVESKLVEKYMRVAIVVPDHQEFMRTCAPSEPILAEAAGYTCNLSKDAPRVLAAYFGEGILARGERGEVVGRLLWTIAHDRALGTVTSSGHHPTPIFHLPIKVLDLLKSLFAPQLHNKLLHAKPMGDVHGPDLETAFANAYVSFSHFARAGDEEMLTGLNLCTALVRGMALQSQEGQRSIDAVIPIHLGELSDSILPPTTSAINIQIKNRQQCRQVHVNRSITVPNHELPCLSVVMELGDHRAMAGTRKDTDLIDIQDIKDTPVKILEENQLQEVRHYSVIAYGHGPDTYCVVPKEEVSRYSRILAPPGPLEDFPREEHEENVALVYGMKPFFMGAKNSPAPDWIDWEE